MKRGYVSLWRKILDWEWYDEPLTTRLFEHLLLIANHEDNVWRGITVKRGQLVTWLSDLSKQTGISVRSIRTGLDRLEESKCIDKQTTNKYTLITICNYDSYQSCQFECDKQTTNKRQTNDKQTTDINNNYNNIINNISISRKLDIDDDSEKKTEKSPKKPKEKTIVTKGREIFEEERKTLYPDEPYYWQAKDAKSMKTLLDKIKFSRKEKELPIDDESLLDALRGYFKAVIKLDDDFYNDFDVCKLSSQYNAIVTKIKTKKNGIRKQRSRAFVAEPSSKEEFLAEMAKFQK